MSSRIAATGLFSAALKGTIAVPGDKSLSHRALIIGTVAQSACTIVNLLESTVILKNYKIKFNNL